ncbi:MAG: thioesterase [Prevotella sp.]|nr:thioesterase [Prevotella sp.]
MCEKRQFISKVGKYDFLAEPFHCDFTHHLLLGHVGNLMLNAADFHSQERGYGMTYLNTIHRTWVLSRLAIEMETMPAAYDHFSIETWVESAMRYFTSRNFAVTGSDGHVYGYGRSIWAMIDTDTREPSNILEVNDGIITDYIEKEKPCPIKPCSRVVMKEEGTLVRTIGTYYHDVDVNGHINSVKYIEHILDLFPRDIWETKRLERLEIAYVAETYWGDSLHFYTVQSGENEWTIRLTKSTNGDGNEKEVVRSSVKFVNK